MKKSVKVRKYVSAEGIKSNYELLIRNLKTQKLKFRTIFVCCLLLTAYSLLSLTGCTRQDRMFRESRVLMDTYCTITVVSSSEEEAKEAIEAGFAEIKKLDTYLNNFPPHSEISTVSQSAGIKPVKVSQETLDLMQKTFGSSSSGISTVVFMVPILSESESVGRFIGFQAG